MQVQPRTQFDGKQWQVLSTATESLSRIICCPFGSFGWAAAVAAAAAAGRCRLKNVKKKKNLNWNLLMCVNKLIEYNDDNCSGVRRMRSISKN